MNCTVFGDLGSKFESECTKGTRVLVGGILKEVEKDGRTFVNFTVQTYEKLSTYIPPTES